MTRHLYIDMSRLRSHADYSVDDQARQGLQSRVWSIVGYSIYTIVADEVWRRLSFGLQRP